jgi:primosomal replication protein N
VECELDAVAFGSPAQALAGLKSGDAIRLNGFIERKGVRDPRPILHVTEFELIQGATHGFLPS